MKKRAHALRRVSILLGLCCAWGQGVHAVTVNDFGYSFGGAGYGQAVDINNAGEVLLFDASKFTIMSARYPVATVAMGDFLASNGFTNWAVSDLSNNRHVVGRLSGPDGSSDFFWSPDTGLQLVPTGFAARVNDAGFTVGGLGYWSRSGGAVPLSAIVTDPVRVAGMVLYDIDNQGQLAYVGAPVYSTQGPTISVPYGVMSAKGDVTFSRTAVAQSGTKDLPLVTPDAMRFTSNGSLLVSWARDTYGAPHSTMYNLATQTSADGGGFLDAVNAKGQFVGCDSGISGPISYACVYTDLSTGEAFNLQPLYATSGVPVAINDQGMLLFGAADTYSVTYSPGAGSGGAGGGGSTGGGGTGGGGSGGLPTGTGSGLTGQYFNMGLFGNKLVLTRIENPDFDWSTGSPAKGVFSDFFTVKWTGFIQAEEAGDYELQTLSDEGVRVTLGGKVVIDNWKAHTATVNTSAPVQLEAGKRYAINIEYRELLGKAVMRLKWIKPGAASAAAVPTSRLYDK